MMKTLVATLTAGLLAMSVPAWAQTGMRQSPDSSVKTLPDSGTRAAPDIPEKAPSNSGIVVVPPTTDPEAVTPPPKNIDPGITAPTKEIDRKNRKESEDKPKARQGGNAAP